MKIPDTPLSTPQRPLSGILLIVSATFLFSSHDALSKYLSSIYPIVMVVWVRYLVHTLLMASIFLPKSGLRLLRTKRLWLQILRASCLMGTSLLFTTGLRYVPLAEATAVNFLAPLFVTALSIPFLGESVSRGQWIAVLLGFVGVTIVVHPGGSLFTPAILYPLGSALCFSLYQLLTRKLAAYDGSATSNFLTGIFASCVMTVLVPFYWETPQVEHLLPMLALGTCGMLGHLLLSQAFRHAAPALLAPFSYCQIIFAGLLGALIFAHIPDVLSLLGILVICLSGFFAAWQHRKATVQTRSPVVAAAGDDEPFLEKRKAH